MGFSADPFVRWICPEAGNYMNFIGAFNAYGGKAVDTNTAYVVEGFKGTALWLPPNIEADEEAPFCAGGILMAGGGMTATI